MSHENVEIVGEAVASFARTGEFGSLLAPDAVLVNAPGSPFSVKGSGPTAIRGGSRRSTKRSRSGSSDPTRCSTRRATRSLC
jgi:hypothetical protein